MNRNIFEGAKFGDEFITYDNRVAKFVCVTKLENNTDYCLYIDGEKIPMWYDEEGTCLAHNNDFNIVSKRVLNDDEIVNKLAKEAYPKEYTEIPYYDSVDSEVLRIGFKNGYRKAKEEEKINEIPSYNTAAKMWNICDEYSCQNRIDGWTWDGAVKFIQDNWNNPDFNIDYKNINNE